MGVVRWSLEARADFRGYRLWLRREAGSRFADPWIDELTAWIDELNDFPLLGAPRKELGVEIRTRVFRRTITIAYVPAVDGVTIMRMFSRGRNITAADFPHPR